MVFGCGVTVEDPTLIVDPAAFTRRPILLDLHIICRTVGSSLWTLISRQKGLLHLLCLTRRVEPRPTLSFVAGQLANIDVYNQTRVEGSGHVN